MSPDTNKQTEPIYFKVPRQVEETVRVEMWNLPYFYRPIHYHEESQITYILESDGILFIGDRLTPFHEGELFFIGKNIPHVFRHDRVYYNNNSSYHAKAISIFFSSKTFEDTFKAIPESSALVNLMEKAKFGFKIERKQAIEFENHIKKVLNITGIERVLELLYILHKLSVMKNIQVLMTKTPMILEPEDSRKLDKIFNFLLNNYMRKVYLNEVAKLINFTPSSFCRYFKQRTNKTFIRFLIEIRISKACKFLVDGENVAGACYSSGYNNISNFHRHFKHITGMTPNGYKKKILQKV